MKSDLTLLSTQNLMVGYGDGLQTRVLFTNLNLQLRQHQMVCFMGPNGTGKSTLIRTLAGLQRPLSGDVQLHGADDLPSNRKVAVVLTDRVSNENMTAMELITFGRYPYLDWRIRLSASDRAAIDHAIQLTRIEPYIHQKLHKLSDGQVQMVMIARALAQDCGILLLDEPTAHLDLNNRVEIMNLLRDLARTTNKAILISTHDLHLALQTASDVWLAGKNKTIVTGLPEDLVLNGTFDDIFQLKGFNLKTGRVDHPVLSGRKISLSGSGPEYLWTKNALERSGYIVDTHGLEISILISDNLISWTADSNTFFSLKDLMAYLSTL